MTDRFRARRLSPVGWAWIIGLVAMAALTFGGSYRLRMVAGGTHAGLAFIVGAVLTAGAAWLAVQMPDESRTPAVVLAVAIGFATFVVGSDRSSSREYVQVYCAYGAVSQAQLAGCRNHVTANQIDRYETPAATNARSVVYDSDEAPSEPELPRRGAVSPTQRQVEEALRRVHGPQTQRQIDAALRRMDSPAMQRQIDQAMRAAEERLP